MKFGKLGSSVSRWAAMGFLQRLFGGNDSKPEPRRWTEAEYEALWGRVLDGVAQGWGQQQVLAELGDRVDDQRFYQGWLVEKFGAGLLKAPERDEELGRRLTRLGELDCGQVSRMAGLLAAALLKKQPEVEAVPQSAPLEKLEPLEVEAQGETEEDFLLQALGYEERLALGQQQLELGFYEGALQSFDQAIELAPERGEAWQQKAEALKRLNRYAEANTALERAIKLQMAPLVMDAGFWFNRLG